MKVTVQKRPLELALDLQLVAEQCAEGMRDFWAAQMDAGKQPDGEPLPLNKQRRPLGRGRGTLIRNWQVRRIGRARGIARAQVQPFKRGRYAHAVWQLAKRGLRFQSFEGESAGAWRRVATEAALAELEAALRRRRSR